MPPIQQNLQNLLTKIHELETQYHRPTNSVKLLAVSKKHPLESIQQALTSGQFAFGESYLQEALPKISALSEKKIEWHFIGPIQSNKTKKIAENFQWVQSVADIRMAERLNNQRPTHLPRLNICLEINVDNEPNKSGISPNDALELAKKCLLLPNLSLRGIMAIPQAKKNFTEQRPAFHTMKQLYDHLTKNGLNIDTLSIGMSDDMEAAIAEGSTMVRIGTALFGERI